MKFRILALLTLMLPVAASAQKVPDNDDVFARTIDSASPFNYAALMLRYESGDTTLTLEDYHYLYYGFAFTDVYKPLNTIPAEDRILAILDRFGGEDPDYDGMMEIIREAREVMKSDPFSPKNINFLVYAYGAIGDTINEQINHDRFEKIIGVIELSGSGLKENEPMHVLRFTHAADLLAARDLTITNRRVVSRSTEYISVAEKVGKVRGYYFDFSRVFWSAPDEAPKKERRWKINDWPVDRL